jgi:HSP20 family molecular chaperone IbpA
MESKKPVMTSDPIGLWGMGGMQQMGGMPHMGMGGGMGMGGMGMTNPHMGMGGMGMPNVGMGGMGMTNPQMGGMGMGMTNPHMMGGMGGIPHMGGMGGMGTDFGFGVRDVTNPMMMGGNIPTCPVTGSCGVTCPYTGSPLGTGSIGNVNPFQSSGCGTGLGSLGTGYPILGRTIDQMIWKTGNIGSKLWIPRVNVFDEGETVRVEVELPGVKNDEVRVNVKDTILTITPAKPIPLTPTEKGLPLQHETHFGYFFRQLLLPDTVEAKKVAAEMEDGILRITLPKAPDAQGAKVNVQKK